MTDEQIIKALKGGVLNDDRVKSKCWSIEIYKLKNAIDLASRQKAEIERLNGELKVMRGVANSYKLENERLQKENERWKNGFMGTCMLENCKLKDEWKSEAIKEFAKYIMNKSQNGTIQVSDIPDYAKEMTEVQE